MDDDRGKGSSSSSRAGTGKSVAVFCGCQTYPSASSSGSKSAWEWGIATPRQKSKLVSKSNPVFPSTKLQDMSAINKRFSDNLYEPVNPPPLHDTGSAVFYGKDTTDTGSLDGRRRIDIPPEIEIVNSEGLDGLDQPDPHDYGMDGDREWVHSEDEQVVPSSKICFTAGIRGGDDKTTTPNKTISFDPTTKNGSYDEDLEDMSLDVPEVPSGSRSGRSRSRSRSPNPTGPPKKTTTAFEILKNKAADAAGQLKQRFSLPVRPKLSQGKKAGKKGGGKQTPAAAGTSGDDQVAPMEEEGGGEEVAKLDQLALPGDNLGDDDMEEEEPISTSSSVKEAQAQAAELLRKEKEAAAEEKKRKQKEQDDLKKQKAEEKKREAEEKKREADEIKRQKAEEKAKAKEEADKKKAEEKALKAKLAEEAKKAKLEEQLAKARELEEQERLKNEELLRLREQEAAARGAFDEEDQQESPPEFPFLPDVAPGDGDMEEDGEQVKDAPTPTGTGSRKKKLKKTFVQLPKLPDIPRPTLPSFDLDFKRKVIKRSKTPPARPTPPKLKQRRGGDEESAENQLAAQYAGEIAARKAEFEDGDEPPPVRSVQFPQTPIFVTQPSTENNSVTTETESMTKTKDWKPPPRSDDFMDNDEPSSPYPGPSATTTAASQPGAKERFDKFGQQLKGFGQKSKDIASKKSKAMGATMKVIGKDLQKFGVKTSEKFQATIEEIKLKQEAAKARTKELQAQKAKEAEDAMSPPMGDEQEDETVLQHPDYATEPRRKFRFRRRDDSQEESQHQSREQEDDAGPSLSPYDDQQQSVQQHGAGDDGDKITRSQLLGRAERDWESPLEELASRSRDVSEDRGNVSSSRDSPPGSSLASSTFGPHVATTPAAAPQHVRKRGVLEEIDSDEFFLREKGISEGEDEEEINRFLVEELRQAFRFQENALAGFDLDPEEEAQAPQRPGRQPRKPARKEKDNSAAYQTFPPERPRRKAPGYVSDYIKDQQQQGEAGDEEEEDEDLGEFDENNSRRVIKDELEEIEHQIINQQFIDDGRYEPVVGGGGNEPVKPTRNRRSKKKEDSASPLYYNTVAGNDWMREAEETTSSPPAQVESEDVTFVDAREDNSLQDRSGGGAGDDDADFDDMEYVDDAGYAVVRKERPAPRTVPRSKKNKRGGGGSKGSSLKRQQDQTVEATDATATASTSSDAFFSLPRFTPRSLHIIPPSRPQRNYSTLRPRRPPRQGRSSHTPTSSTSSPKGGAKGGEKSGGGGGDGAASPQGSRPSTAIGIMQGRPLPAIPSTERAPRLNDLDQSSIERAVGARHYANFVEEACVATNIPLLGTGGGGGGDINIAIQTDPVQTYEEDEAAGGGQRQSDSQTTGPTSGLKPQQRAYSTGRVNQGGDGDQQQQQQRPLSSAASGEGFPSDHQFQFPRRLHLHELEVDVLRVHDLSAHSITADSLRASQIEVNSLTSTGPLTVSSIHTQTLNSHQVNCNRLASDTVDLPTIVPPAFYNLSSPSDPSAPDTKEELRREPESDIPCPYEEFENMDEFGKHDLSVGSPIGDFFGRSLEFCLTPEQSVDVDNDDASWGQQVAALQEQGQGEEQVSKSTTRVEDDLAHCSDLPCDEEELNELSGTTEPLATWTGEEPEEQEQEQKLTFSLDRHSFRIAAVLENEEEEEEDKKEADLNFYLQDEAPVLSGSLRLEYRRSPEVPSDFQVLHDIVETEEAASSANLKSPPTPPPRRVEPEVTKPSTPPPPPQLVPTRRPEPEVIVPPTLPPRQVPSPPLRGSTNLLERRTTSTESSSSSGGRSSDSVSRTTSTSRETSTIRISEASAIIPPTPQLQLVQRPEEEVEEHHGDETLVHMSIRFVHVVTRVMMRGLQAIVDYVDIATTDDPTKAEEQRAHMQVLLCLLLILLAGIILSSSSSVVSFSPPKWEFLMPPPHL